jgi:hypothetical protein
MVSAILSVLPHTDVRKRDAKGETRFCRSNDAIRSKVFKVNGKVVLEVQGKAKQTVLPPTVHPDTGRPYKWLGDRTLFDTKSSELPELADDIADRLAEVLRPFGHQAEPDRRPLPNGEANFDDCDTIWAQLNAAALADIEAWIHHVGLTNLKRSGGGYTCLATWRPSDKQMSQRDNNVGIHPNGIKDFGTDEGMSPIDLVMEAHSCEFHDACEFLREKLGVDQDGIVIDLKPKAEPKQPVSEHDAYSVIVRGTKIVSVQAIKVLGSMYRDIKRRGDIKTSPFGDGIILQTRLDDSYNEASLENIVAGADGLVGDIAACITDSATRPQPVLSFGAALIIVGALIGQKDAGPTLSASHLYVLGLGDTGVGKDHLLKKVDAFFVGAGMEKLIGPSMFHSQSAVLSWLRDRPRMVCLFDEFDSIVGKSTNRNASGHEAGITSELRKLWSMNFGVYRPHGYAATTLNKEDREKLRMPIYNPAMSIFAMSTPDAFFAELGNSNLANGFLNHFLLLPAIKVPEVKPTRDKLRILESILHEMKMLNAVNRPPLGTDRIIGTSAVVHEWAPEAEAMYVAYKQEVEARIEADKDLEKYIERCPEMAVRIANIVAAGRDPEHGTWKVEPKDILLGIAVTRQSGDKLIEYATTHMFDAVPGYANALKRVDEVTRRHRSITLARLCDHTQGLDPNMRDRAIKELVTRSKLTKETRGRGHLLTRIDD